MMLGSVLWQKALAGWGDKGVSDVSKYDGGTAFWRVEDETDTKLVG